MATFPEFRLTGPTISLEDKPLEFKPLNLLPLIELLRESKQPIGKSSSGEKSGKKEDEIKGRIGAVEQYQNALDKEMNIVNKGLQLYGSSFVDTPEYKSAMNRYERLSSDERKNIIKRQTEDTDAFKEAIKGKGAYFHTGQWIASGLQRDKLKRVKDWQNILERGYTEELGPEKGDERFIENFDYQPILLSYKDAQAELDNIFNPAAAGSQTVKQFGETFSSKKVGQLYGSIETEWGRTKERNFGVRVEEINGQKVETPIGVSEAYNQAVARAMSQAFDPTDVIGNGYLQAFLQSNASRMDEYYDRDGKFDSEKFGSNFEVFMRNDIIMHMNKRKKDVDENTDKQRFKEASAEGYKSLYDSEQEMLMIEAQKQSMMSVDQNQNLGIPVGEIFHAWGTELLNSEDNFILNIKENQPFILNPYEGTPGLLTLNPNFDIDSMTDDESNVVWKKAYDFHKDMNPKLSESELKEKASKTINKIKRAYNDVNNNLSLGKGVFGYTRNDINTSYIPSPSISDKWWQITNNENLIGQSAKDFGLGTFVQIGSSYLPLTNFGSLKYGGTEGEIMFQPNQMPSNLETYYMEESPFELDFTQGVDANGNVPRKKYMKKFNWNSQEWLKLPDSEKAKILQLAKEQESQNPMLGTKFRDLNGMPSTTVEHKSSETRVMDKFTSDAMSVYVSNRNNTNNAIYASSGAVVQKARYYGKDEAEIIKILENNSINVEIPLNYGRDKQYKQEYDATFGRSIYNWGKQLEVDGIINQKSNFSKVDPGAGNKDLERTVEILGIPSDQKQKFMEKWMSLPPGTPRYKIEDLVIQTKVYGNVQNWNWNTVTPRLKEVKLAENGKLTNEGKKYVTIETKKVDEKNPYGASIVLPTNMTPVIGRSGSSFGNNVMQSGLNAYEAKNLNKRFPTAPSTSKLNFANAQK